MKRNNPDGQVRDTGSRPVTQPLERSRSRAFYFLAGLGFVLVLALVAGGAYLLGTNLAQPSATLPLTATPLNSATVAEQATPSDLPSSPTSTPLPTFTALPGTGGESVADIPTGETAQASPEPGEPWIAYVGKDGFIWLIRPDGSEVHRLSDQPGSNPTWSPDGNWLAFEAQEGSVTSLIAVQLEEGQQQLLVQNGHSPAWSADGRKLAFVRYQVGGNEPAWQIYTIDVDTSQETAVAQAVQEFPDPEPWMGAAWHALDQEEGNLAGAATGLQWATSGDSFLLHRVYAGTWAGEWEVAHITGGSGQIGMLAGGYYAALSPQGDQVAYCAEGNLYLMKATGTNALQLSHTDDCRQPVWAPDGNFLLFSSGNAIWRINADGHDEYPVVQPDAFGCAHYSIDSEGKAFAFSQIIGDDDAAEVSIWRAMVDGSNLLQLAKGGQPAWQPAHAWSEAENVVARQTPTLTPSPTPSPTPTPTPTNSPTSTPTMTPKPKPKPTQKPKPTATPSKAPLNPMGKIAFRSSRGGIWIMNPDGSNQQLLQNTNIYYRALELDSQSPDLDKRVIVKKEYDWDAEIYYVWANGQLIFQLTGNDSMDWDPVLSADGYWVAFVTNRNGNDEIYIETIQATEERRLSTNDWEWDKHPSWSPDGQQIAFYSNRITGRRQIWVMNRDGTNAHNISNNQYEDWDPVWIKRW